MKLQFTATSAVLLVFATIGSAAPATHDSILAPSPRAGLSPAPQRRDLRLGLHDGMQPTDSAQLQRRAAQPLSTKMAADAMQGAGRWMGSMVSHPGQSLATAQNFMQKQYEKTIFSTNGRRNWLAKSAPIVRYHP